MTYRSVLCWFLFWGHPNRSAPWLHYRKGTAGQNHAVNIIDRDRCLIKTNSELMAEKFNGRGKLRINSIFGPRSATVSVQQLFKKYWTFISINKNILPILPTTTTTTHTNYAYDRLWSWLACRCDRLSWYGVSQTTTTHSRVAVYRWILWYRKRPVTWIKTTLWNR